MIQAKRIILKKIITLFGIVAVSLHISSYTDCMTMPHPADDPPPAEQTAKAPAEPKKPSTSAPAKSPQPAKPPEPAKPAKPAKPPEPAKPAKPPAPEPAKPAKPPAPEPAKPAKPPAPEPAKPAKPPAPEPAKPAKPPAPEPAKPAKPPAPEPAKPAKPPAPEPVAPPQPTKPPAPAPVTQPSSKPEPPKAPPPPERARDIILDGAEIYTVVEGDTLSHIARNKYGAQNIFYYPLIIMASRDLIVDQDYIETGMVITIPNLQANLADDRARASMKAFFLEIADITDRVHKRSEDAAGLRTLANSLGPRP